MIGTKTSRFVMPLDDYPTHLIRLL